MNRRFAFVLAYVAGLPLLVAGCGSSTSVSGHVVFEGKAVENGAITFLPADGFGPTAGAPIENGQYRIDKLVPGKKTVQVIGVKKINFAVSNEELKRQADLKAKHGDATGIVERADEIPADAEGNNRQIDLAEGNQTIDFELKLRKK